MSSLCRTAVLQRGEYGFAGDRACEDGPIDPEKLRFAGKEQGLADGIAEAHHVA